MHFARTTESLAATLHNFDPFGYHADFGFILPNDDRMSAWFSACTRNCCALEYI